MGNILWTLLVIFLLDNFKTYGELVVSKFEDHSNLISDAESVTCEALVSKRTSLINCAVDCSHLSWCVAFFFNSRLQTCCLLKTLMAIDSVIQRDEDIRINGYFVKQPKQPEETIECPGVWEENDGSKYCFVISKADWDLAERKCSMMGGHLVAIESESEDKWIYERLNFYTNITGPDAKWWSGGTDKDSEDFFYWQHSRQNLTFEKWNLGDPSGDKDENCLLLLLLDHWQDYPCSDEYSFICEK
uniref:C-type lectin domain-containing protein n=1 Tax=Magallana gigas TaxID=29159 RepID=A0A8W8IGJ3_MAGGI